MPADLSHKESVENINNIGNPEENPKIKRRKLLYLYKLIKFVPLNDL